MVDRSACFHLDELTEIGLSAQVFDHAKIVEARDFIAGKFRVAGDSFKRIFRVKRLRQQRAGYAG